MWDPTWSRLRVRWNEAPSFLPHTGGSHPHRDHQPFSLVPPGEIPLLTAGPTGRPPTACEAQSVSSALLPKRPVNASSWADPSPAWFRLSARDEAWPLETTEFGCHLHTGRLGHRKLCCRKGPVAWTLWKRVPYRNPHHLTIVWQKTQSSRREKLSDSSQKVKTRAKLSFM